MHSFPSNDKSDLVSSCDSDWLQIEVDFYVNKRKYLIEPTSDLLKMLHIIESYFV